MSNHIQDMHGVAVRVFAAMALRELLATAVEVDPSVVSVRLEATDSEDGVELSMEAIGRDGLAIAGASL